MGLASEVDAGAGLGLDDAGAHTTIEEAAERASPLYCRVVYIYTICWEHRRGDVSVPSNQNLGSIGRSQTETPSRSELTPNRLTVGQPTTPR